jgi:uracil-DNA glycosylase
VDELEALTKDIAACRICVERPLGQKLPHAPRPVAWPSATARILIAGQAPGTRVHASGRPFTDPSGDRLRQWLGVTEDIFYDRHRIAIVPMGFCFPGLDAKGSDLPPRPECRATWHDRLMAAMPQVDLILAVGATAQAYHMDRLGLGSLRRPSLTATVANWRNILAAGGPARLFVTPHPSWRNSGWLKRHPWFEAELLPVLRAEVALRL